jgi:hypothetical protein
VPDRIQREVEELLKGLDALPPEKPLGRRIMDALTWPFRAAGDFISGLNLPRFNAGHLLLLSLVIVVVAYVVGGDSPLWNIIIATGIILFIVAFVLSLRHQSKKSSSPRYWRDRPMDIDERDKRNRR